MEPQKNTTSSLSGKHFFVLIVLLILSSAIGAVVGGMYYPREKVGGQTQSSVSYSPPVISYSNSNVNTNPTQEIHSIFGTVKTIKGNTFTLKENRVQVPGATQGDRSIIVNSDTKILKGEMVDSEIAQKQISAYMKNIEDTKKEPVLSLPPDVMRYTEVSPADVKIGDSVVVTTIENIVNQEILIASKIQIESKFEKIPTSKK